MAESDKSFLNRRELARGAMLGGASALLAGAALAAPGTPASGELLDVRKLGATGDGKTDDTQAIQRAFDAAGRRAAASSFRRVCI
jgi:polygalacturonase